MRKDNNWKIVLLVAVIFICIGSIAYIFQSNDKKIIKDNNNRKEEVKETETKEIDNKEQDEANEIVETNEDNSSEKYKETEKFKNQEGENVEVSGDKIVSATGFAGASNYKFYLRKGTLYFRNISTDKEEIIATGVKDLYLENKEVTAELSEEGKIIKENNYINYK